MSGERNETSSPAPAKFSRYRSVRHPPVKAPQQPEEPLPQQRDPDVASLGRTKSMARYRRSRVGTIASEPAPPPMPSMPSPVVGQQPFIPKPATRRVTEPTPSPRQQYPPSQNADSLSQLQGQARESEGQRSRRKMQELREQEVAVEEQRRQADQQLRMAQQQRAHAEEQARLMEEETARLLAEQKRKDLERLEAQLAAAVPNTPPRVTTPREKFSFFSRKRAATKTSGNGAPPGANPVSRGNEPPLPRSIQTTPTSPGAGSSPQRNVGQAAPGSTAEQSKMIEQGGGGIVPQTDAPISASNAGERRVLIRCKQSSINLPFDPETTPVDLVFTAANVMTQNINPSTAVLLESYAPLGLERRVRRYEHIRDIVNSWDRDTQNSFMIQTSDSPQFDKDLEVSLVSKRPPQGAALYMYHSQKPGKWNKRHITLLPTGQIYMAKKPGIKASDKDITNLCHLTDFDIYTATPQYTRKVLRPPKKHCYAIKSQQKTSMFLSTENFVHYFSTDDESVADKWYAAVQQWRSWYLINRMGGGARKKPKSIHSPAKPTTNKPSHTRVASMGEDPYTIGSFTPLFDGNHRFDQDQPQSPIDREYKSDGDNPPRQMPFHLRNGNSVPSRRDSRRHPPSVSYRLPPEEEGEFSSSGLLGRTYSQRQQLQKEREKQQQQQDSSQPFTGASSLLNKHGGDRAMSMKSIRSIAPRSKRPENAASPGMPKPLLDFAPEFKEPPQWDKKGKGHGVRPVEGVPLVEVATGHHTEALNMGHNQTLFRRDQVPAMGSRAGTEGAFIKGGLVSGL